MSPICLCVLPLQTSIGIISIFPIFYLINANLLSNPKFSILFVTTRKSPSKVGSRPLVSFVVAHRTHSVGDISHWNYHYPLHHIIKFALMFLLWFYEGTRFVPGLQVAKLAVSLETKAGGSSSISNSTAEVHALVYGSTLRWFENLKFILSGVSRPTRRDPLFNNTKASSH